MCVMKARAGFVSTKEATVPPNPTALGWREVFSQLHQFQLLRKGKKSSLGGRVWLIPFLSWKPPLFYNLCALTSLGTDEGFKDARPASLPPSPLSPPQLQCL